MVVLIEEIVNPRQGKDKSAAIRLQRRALGETYISEELRQKKDTEMTEILFRDNPGFKGVKDEFDPSVVVEEDFGFLPKKKKGKKKGQEKFFGRAKSLKAILKEEEAKIAAEHKNNDEEEELPVTVNDIKAKRCPRPRRWYCFVCGNFAKYKNNRMVYRFCSLKCMRLLETTLGIERKS